MRYILLLGAGFSHNWGGWLASEAFEYLLGIQDLDDHTLNLLWEHKDRGGFEDALAVLQDELSQRGTDDAKRRLESVQRAVSQMFQDMDQAFAQATLEPKFQGELTLTRFLVRFDAIFTLNQDTLLEHHYLHNAGLISSRRWNGYQVPGMRANADRDPIKFYCRYHERPRRGPPFCGTADHRRKLAKKKPVRRMASLTGYYPGESAHPRKHQPRNANLLRCNLKKEDPAYFNGFSNGTAVFLWGWV